MRQQSPTQRQHHRWIYSLGVALGVFLFSNLIRAFTFPPCQLPATYLNGELVELKIESE